MTMPFFAHKDFFPSPLINLVLLSYVEVQIVALATIDSSDPSFGSLNIDLVAFAYIDDLALDA
jgi:hypothetical protein